MSVAILKDSPISLYALLASSANWHDDEHRKP
jgi:hypothetical protein